MRSECPCVCIVFVSISPKLLMIRYDTRCYFSVRSKANMSQFNLPHGTMCKLHKIFCACELYCSVRCSYAAALRYVDLGISVSVDDVAASTAMHTRTDASLTLNSPFGVCSSSSNQTKLVINQTKLANCKLRNKTVPGKSTGNQLLQCS